MILPYIYPNITGLAAGGGSYALPDVLSMPVIEERNGAFELEMKYLYAGENAAEIQTERILMQVPQKDADFEPFRIYEVGTPIDGVITVKARILAYDLAGVYLTPFRKVGITNVINELNTQISAQTPFFELQTDIVNTTSQLSTSFPHNAWSMIGGTHSLLSVFGGELSYHWDAAQSKMIVKLHAQRGDDSNATIAYGVNLLTLDSRVNAENVYSAVYPFAKKEINDQTQLVTLPEETIATGSLTGQTRVLVRDFSSEFTELPTEAELRAACNAYIAAHEWDPQQSVAFEFVPLENTTEYSGQEEYDIDLCDTVHVSAELIGVAATAKIVRTVYDPLREKYDSMTVGTVEQTIADTIVEIDKRTDTDPGVPVEYVPAENIVLQRRTASNVSVPDDTWTNTGGPITLDPGTYVINAYAQFGVGAGIRQIRVGTSANVNTSFAVGASASAVASNAVSDDLCFSITLELTSTITLYLNVRQNSGSSINAYARLSALRVK